MIHRRLVVSALLMAAFPLHSASTSAQDPAWPGFRGPGRDGIAAGATPPLVWSDTENLSWKTELPGPGSSSPIVAGDRVYVACYSGYGDYLEDGGDPRALAHHVVCLARKSGKILWDKTVPGPLDKEARQIQLKQHGFASPTPVTDGETIYAYFGHAGVVAVDAAGRLVWQAGLGAVPEDGPAATNQVKRNGKALSLRWGAAASPLLHENLVIVNASEESNSIRALDKRTGELVWKYESPNLEGSAISPVLVGPPSERILVIALGGETWGLAPLTGKLLWRVETGTRGGMSPTPVADERHVYVFGGQGKSHALRFARAVAAEGTADTDPRIVWQSENLGIPSPLLHDGRLFLVRTNGIAVCLDAKDGSVLFNGRLDGRTGSVYASPVLAAGRLYVVSRKRGTFVYSADGKFELLAHNELEDRSQFNASPAIVGKDLLLRSDTHLYRFTRS